jgi:hypothetical protein
MRLRPGRERVGLLSLLGLRGLSVLRVSRHLSTRDDMLHVTLSRSLVDVIVQVDRRLLALTLKSRTILRVLGQIHVQVMTLNRAMRRDSSVSRIQRAMNTQKLVLTQTSLLEVASELILQTLELVK